MASAQVFLPERWLMAFTIFASAFQFSCKFLALEKAMSCCLAIFSSQLMHGTPRLSLFFKCLPGPMYWYTDTNAPIQSGWIWRRKSEEGRNILHSSTNNLVCKHEKSFSCHHHFVLLHLALGWDAVGTSCSIKVSVSPQPHL